MFPIFVCTLDIHVPYGFVFTNILINCRTRCHIFNSNATSNAVVHTNSKVKVLNSFSVFVRKLKDGETPKINNQYFDILTMITQSGNWDAADVGIALNHLEAKSFNVESKNGFIDI